MERWSNRVAVVTGASSGIGVEVVKDLLKANLVVVGLARRVERMEKFKTALPAEQQKRFHAFACDVASQESVNKAFDWIIKKLGGVDILVNNAGTWKLGQASTMNVTDLEQTLQVNVMGVVYVTQRAFKSMKERNVDGHVVLINSIVGHKIPVTANTGAPAFNLYPPSKYAITALTEVYRQEFNGLGTKIKITSISPGLTDTEIVPENLKSLGYPMLKPEDVSSCIMFTLSTPPHVQIHELTVKPVGGE
ncbi:farnesol dehydrogenase-like [Eurosta solidaginis]|uniref:farnesol dehydrogenase-like n=1 Tax=Eurosta solidaginis TaxID=178769 RepID=UPI003530E391